MPRNPHMPLPPDTPGSAPARNRELHTFMDALKAVYNADAMTVHYEQETIDLFPKPIIFSNQPSFKIFVAALDKMDEKIRELNASRDLFDQFIKSKEKEKEKSYKITRSKL